MDLHEILRPERKTAVVDVGAAAIDSSCPYQLLLDRGLCSVIGFEPQVALWPKPRPGVPRGNLETYLPDVIGDGSDGLLRVYYGEGLTSLFALDPAALDLFPGFKRLGELIRTERVTTRRLDDIDLVERIDYLKIDAQGSELAVIQGADRKLGDAVFVQLEAQFVPLYKNQAMFRDLDAAMHERGFMLHTFPEVIRIMILPYQYPGKPYAAMRQTFSADVAYVRDFGHLGALTDESVKQMAMIAHYCYGSFDLAYRCVDHLCGRTAADAYIETVEPG
jgi:FkbM family methyltransferase